MPMLTTLRIGLPVCPRPLAAADPLAERGHPVEHLVDLLDDVVAVDDQRALARHPQRDVEHGAVLGDVDPLAARTSPRGAPRSPASSASAASSSSVSSVIRFFE